VERMQQQQQQQQQLCPGWRVSWQLWARSMLLWWRSGTRCSSRWGTAAWGCGGVS
jgi:hypothetical protein